MGPEPTTHKSNLLKLIQTQSNLLKSIQLNILSSLAKHLILRKFIQKWYDNIYYFTIIPNLNHFPQSSTFITLRKFSKNLSNNNIIILSDKKLLIFLKRFLKPSPISHNSLFRSYTLYIILTFILINFLSYKYSCFL